MFVGSFSAQAPTRSYAVTTAAGASVALPGIGSVVRIVNEGPSTAYVSIGTGTQVATVPTATPLVTSCPVLAGTDVTFSINISPNLQISAITATGTAVLDIQVGEGQ